jgi:cold-inducible RNA-binding protein
MSTKLYVGGISYNTKEDALKEYFAQAGTVTSVAIIIDKMSGRSAIEMFNGKELDGRQLTVNEARPQEDRPRTGGFNRGGGRDFRGGNRNYDRR